MNSIHRKRYVLAKVLHMAISIAIFYLSWLLFRYGALSFRGDIAYRYNYYVCVGYGVILFFFNKTYNAYLLGFSRIRSLAMSQFFAQVFSVGAIYFVVSISWNQLRNPIIFIPMLFVQALIDCFWSYFASMVYYKSNPPKKTILIYRSEIDKRRFGSVMGKPVGRIYKVVEEFEYAGDKFYEVREKLEGFEAVFVAGVKSRCRNGISKYCVENNIPGFFLPHIGDVLMRGATHIQTFSSPVLFFSHKQIEPEYIFVKRLFDFFFALFGIIITSPIMLITAIAIRLYDRGPAIYKQVRLTKDGKEFKIYKFRSMRIDAEKDGVARLSTGDNDDRITPIGRLVRKCRIDEIPQLFNILKGDMSFVGPRPERPEIAEQYYAQFPSFKLRLQVKAGLTGYAQVYGKYSSDPYEKLEFDLLYINDISLATDLRLIFATFSILGKAESTEGIKEGDTTAGEYMNPTSVDEGKVEGED
ncbi:MAG: sugar transferase [Eubacterium sp.]|nr:sugar transferase [Eubacterium sp.]